MTGMRLLSSISDHEQLDDDDDDDDKDYRWSIPDSLDADITMLLSLSCAASL